jgi:gamma-glutamyltranspeptidase/glutathione hydrolase
MKSALISGTLALMTSTSVFAADLSPANWPVQERLAVEKLEAQTWTPLTAQTVSGSGGMVSATVSPVAVYAGVQTLKAGGNAADAATTVALTQITTQLGSVVSYAGIITLLYYDAKTHRVYSMDGGYNSYLGELDPRSIPVSDLGPLNTPNRTPTQSGAKGRETLVPGFMAGLEAMHRRFGRLPFKNLFSPAIWYDEHGVQISGPLFGFFKQRQTFLARTPEGRAFLAQAGGTSPELGSLFVQPELAATLKAVAEQGSSYMYTGQWGQDFVRIVQREGGKVTAADMARYRPIWSEPYKQTVFGHTVYVNGPPHRGAYYLISALNLAEALKLDKKGPYWSDPDTFRNLARINDAVRGAPRLSPETQAFLKSKGIDGSGEAQLTKTYAAKVAPLLDAMFAAAPDIGPHHSNAIVVVDKDGNIAAITHSINALTWGDTGIVVGGVPIPDSAAFQQEQLALIKAGDRVPHQVLDTIAFDGDKPVLATGSIGSSLTPETIRILVGVLGQHQSLQTVMAQPPLLVSFGPTAAGSAVPVEQSAFPPALMAKLRAAGMMMDDVAPALADALRGTLAAIEIDPVTGRRSAANQPGVMVFNSAQ